MRSSPYRSNGDLGPRMLLSVPAGAVAFWVPDLVIKWLAHSDIPLMTLGLLLTIVPPALAIIARSRMTRRSRSPRRLTLYMLLGIWALGPVAISLGPGVRFGRLSDFLTLWAFFPFSTFSMSAYVGSLFGLLTVSAAFVLLALSPMSTGVRDVDS